MNIDEIQGLEFKGGHQKMIVNILDILVDVIDLVKRFTMFFIESFFLRQEFSDV